MKKKIYDPNNKTERHKIQNPIKKYNNNKRYIYRIKKATKKRGD